MQTRAHSTRMVVLDSGLGSSSLPASSSDAVGGTGNLCVIDKIVANLSVGAVGDNVTVSVSNGSSDVIFQMGKTFGANEMDTLQADFLKGLVGFNLLTTAGMSGGNTRRDSGTMVTATTAQLTVTAASGVATVTGPIYVYYHWAPFGEVS